MPQLCRERRHWRGDSWPCGSKVRTPAELAEALSAATGEHRAWSIYYDTRYYPERMPSADAADRLLIWYADAEQLAWSYELRGMCQQCAERTAERVLALRPFVLIGVLVAHPPPPPLAELATWGWFSSEADT